MDLADKNGLTPVQLALGFVRSRWFVTSVIIAASTLEQLQENLSCVDIELSPENLEHIDQIHARYPNPVP